MTRRAWVLLALLVYLLLLLLTGCSSAPTVPTRVTAQPVPAQCSAACRTSCLPETWPQWQCAADDPGCWDEYPKQVTDPLRVVAENCDKARASCVACLTRLERVDLICGVSRGCSE